jgi:SMODS and SLOG-associating 2TM effector domain 1/Protein of unknown function (DUF4231)
MGSATETELLRWAWDQQSIWSQTADRLQRSLSRIRTVALVLTVAAALFVTAAAQVPDSWSPAGRSLAWLGAVCAGLVVVIEAFVRADRVQDRMRTRAVSEALKAETYTFLAGVAPYRGADRETHFKKKFDAVLDDAADLADHTIGIEPSRRDIPPVTDVGSYATVRVQGQIRGYYRPKSAAMKRRAQWFRGIEIGLAVVAALLSATAAVKGGQGWAAWLPVITTATAAVAAQAAVQRYSALAVEYARACTELERLLRDRVGAQGPSGDDAFVHAAEKVISLQNEAWMARGLAAAKAGPAGEGSPPRHRNPA